MFEDFNYVAPLIEIFVNIIGLAIGVALIFRAHDNRLMLTWGIYTSVIMLLLVNNNVELIRSYNSGEIVRKVYLLSIDYVMINFVVGSLAAVFPIISLRSSWLNGWRKLLLSTPLLLSTLVVLCFFWFDGTSTPLHQTSDIFAQIHRPDVQMRVAIFSVSILMSLYVLAIPFLNHWVSGLRKMSRGMYFYTVAVVLMLGLYFFNATTNNLFVFHTYGYALVLAPIVVSIQFFFNENPLSLPITDAQIDRHSSGKWSVGDVLSPRALLVYEQMEQYMKENTPFIEANYSLLQFSRALEVGQNEIIRAIRERGFSGFAEYVNFWRLEHFKMLALKLPGLSIKELMYSSGFTSRSSFYRLFTQQEKMSPGQFVGGAMANRGGEGR